MKNHAKGSGIGVPEAKRMETGKNWVMWSQGLHLG